MPSLQLVEGVIGTICAIAALYYARQGVLATETSMHEAPLEYVRRNPYAAVFGALALGFLFSSWSMYALPRPTGIAPHPIEQSRIVTKTVVKADPAQTAKIAALQTTINADAQTIAAQNAEIERLKQLLAKSPRRGRRASTIGVYPTQTNPEGTAAALNRAYNPPAAGIASPANAPLSAPPRSTAAAPVNLAPAPANPVQSPAAAPPNGTSQTPATTPPH